MAEHIKTGYDIEDSMRQGKLAYDAEGQKQWVSLSWLKEHIDKQTNDIADKPISVYDTGAWDMLRWLSKLLEEQTKE